jgi:predicted transcriptional regulator
MKREEQDKARILRTEGKSLNEIVKLLGVSKASVSLWVRDVKLTESQRAELTARGYSVDAVEKRRENRIQNTRARHRVIMDSAKASVDSISTRELLLIGTALYWGEGGKTNQGAARIANTDPNVMRLMMRFFREIYSVPEEKFRGHVHTFSHLNFIRPIQSQVRQVSAKKTICLMALFKFMFATQIYFLRLWEQSSGWGNFQRPQ